MSAVHSAWRVVNNDAEYEALINGLKLALGMKMDYLIVHSDSMLVVNQVNMEFQARGPRTELYLQSARTLMQRFKEGRLE
jgi:ribonuclease HI